MERLTIQNKIDLFYNLNLLHENYKEDSQKETLKKIRQQCISINSFRNCIAHANWQSLAETGHVRTKIKIDCEEGFVKFKRVLITPEIIEQKLKELDDLIELVDCYITGVSPE